MLRNLKIRYKGTVLGFFWSLLSPVIMITIYAVFAKILRFNATHPHYLPFLIIGLLGWHYLLLCVNDSLFVILGNSSLIKKTAFPRIILPISMVIANLLNFLLTLMVLLVYLLVIRIHLSFVYLLPVIIIIQTALCMGLAFLISAFNVFFRDTEHILSLVTLAWFFLTPIFYPFTMQTTIIGEKNAFWAFLNPMTGIVGGYRTIFMSEPLNYLTGIVISTLVSFVILFGGLYFFQKVEWRFGDEL